MFLTSWFKRKSYVAIVYAEDGALRDGAVLARPRLNDSRKAPKKAEDVLDVIMSKSYNLLQTMEPGANCLVDVFVADYRAEHRSDTNPIRIRKKVANWRCVVTTTRPRMGVEQRQLSVC